MKKIQLQVLFFLCITYFSAIEAAVYVCGNNSVCAQTVIKALQATDTPFELVDSLHSDDSQNLYIICDAFKLHFANLPKYYIIYQSLDLMYSEITSNYQRILANSVAIWDYSLENIVKYKDTNSNYYYMPIDYVYSDFITLPCSLPTSTLDAYRELLIYSNQKDTDISSHLPALFCYAFLQNPRIIVEAGVRGGESTKPLYRASQLCKAQLIGIDIHPMWAKASYDAMENAFCLEMNDVDFANYYLNSPFKNQKLDLVFIDTSHEYEHTLQEITVFVPLLGDHGSLLFHDSNVIPLANSGYIRLNGSKDFAPGNPRGVTQAIKEYFSIDFDEYSYVKMTFTRGGTTWHMVHYPFCNGLTVIRK